VCQQIRVSVHETLFYEIVEQAFPPLSSLLDETCQKQLAQQNVDKEGKLCTGKEDKVITYHLPPPIMS